MQGAGGVRGVPGADCEGVRSRGRSRSSVARTSATPPSTCRRTCARGSPGDPRRDLLDHEHPRARRRGLGRGGVVADRHDQHDPHVGAAATPLVRGPGPRDRGRRLRDDPRDRGASSRSGSPPLRRCEGSTLGTDGAWWSDVLTTSLRVAAAATFSALIGAAVAAVGRHTAAALGVVFVWTAVIEGLIRGFRPWWSPWLLGDNLVSFLSWERMEVQFAPFESYTITPGSSAVRDRGLRGRDARPRVHVHPHTRRSVTP